MKPVKIQQSLFTIIIIGMLMLTNSCLFSQGTDMHYHRILITDIKHLLYGIDVSPDQKTLAVSSTHGKPFFFFDLETEKVIEEYDIGNWTAGSTVRYSKNGKYVLLGQQHFTDWTLNKDDKEEFEIIETSTGGVIKKFIDYHSVKIYPDENVALTIVDDVIGIYNLQTGKTENAFSVSDATGNIAISNDGKLIAVSHKLYKKNIKNHSTIRNDKKVQKNALKYNHEVTIYDAKTFKELYTIKALYGVIYRLTFSRDDNYLFVMDTPHKRTQQVGRRFTFVNLVDMQTGKPLRKSFMSQNQIEPEFRLTNDNKYLGIMSGGNIGPGSSEAIELHIYDFETGKLAYRFQETYRLYETEGDKRLIYGSSSSFAFLPDNKSVVITMGNQLVEWNFTLDKK